MWGNLQKAPPFGGAFLFFNNSLVNELENIFLYSDENWE